MNSFMMYFCFLFAGGVLKESAPSRIVCVSSTAHEFLSKFDPDDLCFKKSKFGGFISYCQSKLCNILMARELSKRLKGTGMFIFCIKAFLGLQSLYINSSKTFLTSQVSPHTASTLGRLTQRYSAKNQLLPGFGK